MSRFAPKTLRKMPPATREIARLANELASVQTRLANRIGGLVSTEMMARASERVFCSNAAHAEVVDAALGYFRAVDNPKAHAGRKDRGRAGMALQALRSKPSTPTSSSPRRGRGLSLKTSSPARRSATERPPATGRTDGAASLYRDSRPRSHSDRARQDRATSLTKEESKWHAPSTR